MRKILIVTLTLLSFVSSFAQKPKQLLEEKSNAVLAINNLIATGDSVAAQTMLDEFIAKYGMTSDVLTLQASQFEREKRYDDAALKLDQAIAIVTSNDAIGLSDLYYFRIGYTLDPNEKLKYAAASIKANPKNLRPYITQALIFKRLEQYKDAENSIKKAIKLSGGDPDLRSELARIYLLQDNEKKGMKELNNILKDYPNTSDARYLRSLLHLFNGRVESFVDDHLYYLQISRSFDMSYINEIADTAYDYILEYADQILENVMEPEDKAYWEYFEGYIKMVTYRDIEGSLKHLDNAIVLTKDSDELLGRIYAMRLSYYRDTNDEEKAMETITQIEELLKRNNDNPSQWIMTTKARLLVNRKQYQDALQCYSKAIELYSTDSIMVAFYYYMMADINQYKLGNSQAALNNIDSALTYQPDNVPFLYRYARICDKYFPDEAHSNLAKTACEKILAIDTVPSADSYRHFAYALLGRKAEAEEWLGKIMAEFGDNQEYRGIVNYNAACMYSLLKDTYNATRLLMDALENGDFSCEQLNDDSDFDNIRETPEFKSILKIACSDQKE